MSGAGPVAVEVELARRLEAAEAVLLATVIRASGEPPSRPGEKLLLGAAGALAGTLGCSEFDSAARADAGEILRSGRPELRTYRHDLGTIEVYLEPHLPGPGLVILGDTPVGRALAGWASQVGFRVLSSADVPRFTGGDLYVVHTDHDAPDLVDRLTGLLALEPRFVGVMGSRRHTGHHLDELRRRGLPEAAVAAIQTPIGLDLGAHSAPEIALSILAGLVAIRNGAPAGWKR